MYIIAQHDNRVNVITLYVYPTRQNALVEARRFIELNKFEHYPNNSFAIFPFENLFDYIRKREIEMAKLGSIVTQRIYKPAEETIEDGPFNINGAERKTNEQGQPKVHFHLTNIATGESFWISQPENPQRMEIFNHFQANPEDVIENVVMVEVNTGKGNPAYVLMDIDDAEKRANELRMRVAKSSSNNGVAEKVK